MRPLRARALMRGHGPSSNARLAAPTARSTSTAEPTANDATSSLAAGFTWVHVPPSEASHHEPSIQRRPTFTPSSSRLPSTEIVMTGLLAFQDVDPVAAVDEVDRGAHPLVRLGVGQQRRV